MPSAVVQLLLKAIFLLATTSSLIISFVGNISALISSCPPLCMCFGSTMTATLSATLFALLLASAVLLLCPPQISLIRRAVAAPRRPGCRFGMPLCCAQENLCMLLTLSRIPQYFVRIVDPPERAPFVHPCQG